MSRKSPEEKRAQRAHEALERAFSRRDADKAEEILLALSPEAREPHLAAVAPLIVAHIAKEHRCGNWSRLAFWATRVEREPRLLAAASNQDSSEATWTLLWACVRSRQWQRARWFFDRLPELPSQWKDALEVQLSSEGGTPSNGARDLARRLAPPVDPRLGYDARQSGGSPQAVAAPSNHAEVDEAVLACAGLSSHEEFIRTVEGWAVATPDLRSPILSLAAHANRGEILARLASGKDALSPAQFAGEVAVRLGFPAALEAEMALALRAAVSSLASPPKELGRDEARRLASMIRGAAGYATLRASALATLLGARFLAAAKSVALDLIAGFVASPEAPPLLLKALALWIVHGNGESDPPLWLTKGLARLLEQDGELARALGDVPGSVRELVLTNAAEVLKLGTAERFLDQAWGCTEDSERSLLLGGLDALLGRARVAHEGPPPRHIVEAALEMLAEEAELEGDELSQFLATPLGHRTLRELHRELLAEEPGPLPKAARRIWDRFAARVMPFRITYLEMALEQSLSAADRAQAVRWHLGEREGSEKRDRIFDALRQTEGGGCPKATVELLMTLLRDCDQKRDELAKALIGAGQAGLSRPLRRVVADAFALVDAKSRGGPDSPEVLSARLELRLLDIQQRQQQQQQQQQQRQQQRPPSQKKKAKKKPKRKSQQFFLPFGEER